MILELTLLSHKRALRRAFSSRKRLHSASALASSVLRRSSLCIGRLVRTKVHPAPAIQNRRQLCDVLSLTLMLGVSSDKASTTRPPIRRAVDNLVKPESNSDGSDPGHQTTESGGKSCRSSWFRRFLATIWRRKQKGQEMTRRNLLILLIEPRGPEPLASALLTEPKTARSASP